MREKLGHTYGQKQYVGDFKKGFEEKILHSNFMNSPTGTNFFAGICVSSWI
jgi:hypothetical protein